MTTSFFSPTPTTSLKWGVPHAIQVFKELKAKGQLPKKYGIRIDSGDLGYLSREATRMFTEAGFPDAIISGSNDLDEYLIQSLKEQGCTVTSWGVGTKIITADGHIRPRRRLQNERQRTG